MIDQPQYDTSQQTNTIAESSVLSDCVACSPPVTSPLYAGLDPQYCADVDSFNTYSSPCDTLLTPNSNTESPVLHFLSKAGPRYASPADSPFQAQTPPETVQMYSDWNQFGGSASPMQSSNSVHSGYQSRTRLVDSGATPPPAPPAPSNHAPFLGNFGVSGPDEPSQPNSLMFQNYLHEIQNSAPVPVEVPHDQLQPPAELLGIARLENFRHHQLVSRASAASTARRASEPGKRRSQTSPAVARSKKGQTNRRSQPPPKSTRAEDLSNENKNCHGEEIPPRIMDACPSDERIIIELRWKHRNAKGSDMWDLIQTEYEKQTRKRPGKEMLQMKFRRARCKYFIWEDKDVGLLYQAFQKLESERYDLIHKFFLDAGGSRNLRLSPTDIEAKLVELKVEEGLFMERNDSVDIRRRMKLSNRRRRGAQSQQNNMIFPQYTSPPNPQYVDQILTQIDMARGRSTKDLDGDDMGSDEASQALMEAPLWDGQSTARMDSVNLTTAHNYQNQDDMLNSQ